MVEGGTRHGRLLGVILLAALLGAFGCGSDSTLTRTAPPETPIATLTPPAGEQQRSGPTPTATPLESQRISAADEIYGLWDPVAL